MICPHCNIGVNENWRNVVLNLHAEEDYLYMIKQMICPECKKIIMYLEALNNYKDSPILSSTMIHPISSSYPKCPNEVPEKIAKDYNEGCLVSIYSINAAGALFRRCLQHILRSHPEIEKGSLYNEIGQAIDNNLYKNYIADDLDHLRILGNTAAHPIKSKATGEIFEITEEELEWYVMVLQNLFDEQFVTPKRAEERRDKSLLRISEFSKAQPRTVNNE